MMVESLSDDAEDDDDESVYKDGSCVLSVA